MKKAIRNRIVGYGDVDIDSVVFNEKNWRIHPKNQQDGLSGILEDVGLVLGVLINKRTDPSWGAASQGVETLIDGHLRVTLADRAGEKTIPVTYVDLTEKELENIIEYALQEEDIKGYLKGEILSWHKSQCQKCKGEKL